VTTIEEHVRGYMVIEGNTAERLALAPASERTSHNRIIGIVGAVTVSLALWAAIIAVVVAVS